MSAIEKMILPGLVTVLIALVSYIYVDFKQANKEQIQELKTIVKDISGDVKSTQIENVELESCLKDHEKRITKLEYHEK